MCCTRTAYSNYVVRAEFWASNDANSGIFNRCKEPKNPGDETCYEANIFDDRPKPEYGTGALVDVAKVDPMPKAGGRWNTYHITAKGDHLVAVLNGVKTAEGHDARFKSGVIGLQHGVGAKNDSSPVKYRNVQIRPF